MTALLASLALSFTLAQAPAQPGHEAPVAAPAPRGVGEPTHGTGTTPHAPDVQAGPDHEAGHAAPSEPAHGDEHAAGGHDAGGHGGSLSDVMLHHVSDGHVLEYPGVCGGGFKWDCELDLKHVFGDSLVFGGLDLTPTKHLIMMWLASALLLVCFLVATKKRHLVPKGFYNFLELLVQFVRDEIAVKNIGKHDADRFVPYLCTAFFFILFVNLFGLLPFSATATGNISVTVALALFTFVITQAAAIKAQGLGGWLHHLTGGVAVWLWPIMVPVEILGLFTKPFALTVRLFANMVAGHIVILSLIGLIFALGSPFVALGSVPMALAIFGLELFVAFVQAYIFTMLSSLFIGAGLAHHGHDEDHAAHGAEPGMGHAHDAHH
jgi:F-type H+-transporting ATPase subunit a